VIHTLGLAAFLFAAQLHPATADDHGRWTMDASHGSLAQIELRWDDKSQWRRAIDLTELSGVSAEQINSAASGHVAFRIDQDAGSFQFDGAFANGRGVGIFHFEPHRSFVDTLQSLGILRLGEVTDRDLMNLAWGDFSASAARNFRTLGFTSLTKDEMMDLAVQHVSPEFVKTLRSVGVKEIATVPQVVELQLFGVTPEFVKELATVGIRGLSGHELVDLRFNGVTTEFVRSLYKSGRRNLSVQSLVEAVRAPRQSSG
jgi:hypothetical protein